MGASASGKPQQMPQQGQSGPIMDYSSPTGTMAQYGGGMAMPGNQGGYQKAVMPDGWNSGQGGYQKAVMPDGWQDQPNAPRPGMPMPMPMPRPGTQMRHHGMPVQNPGMPMPNPGMPHSGGSLRPGQQPGGLITRPINDSPNGGILRPAPPVQNPGMPSAGKSPKGAFQGLNKGTMPAMKKHVQAGKMGQARKAFEAGGGKWTKDVHKRLKKKYS